MLPAGTVALAGEVALPGGPATLAATGPAQYSASLVLGVYDVYYYCSTAGCRSRGLPTWAVVYRALRVD